MFAFYNADTTELIGHAESYLPCPLVKMGHKHEPHDHKSHLHFCQGHPVTVPTYTLETPWPFAEFSKERKAG